VLGGWTILEPANVSDSTAQIYRVKFAGDRRAPGKDGS